MIGAAHAGWRSAAAGVIEATVAAMVRLGASPAAIVAAIGPCIGQGSYEVGPDLRNAILAQEPELRASSPRGIGRRTGSSTSPATAPPGSPPPTFVA